MIKRSLKSLVPDTMSHLDDLDTYLDVLLVELERNAEVERKPWSESREVDHVKEAQRTLNKLNSDVKALVEALDRLLAQRKTTREAFEAGYRGRYLDLLSKLSGEEHDLLRRALKQDVSDEIDLGWKSDVPF